jgi:glycosyltransferase involved in cell wall biosynthesis
MSIHNVNVILAGVVPPPVHGASIATKALFDADLQPIVKNLVEIRSSKKLQEIGKASFGKLVGLVFIVAKCLKLKISSRSNVLYYTPGSAATVPFIRDVVFLGLCRPFFRRTILHYHSGGLVEYLNASVWRKYIGRCIYGCNSWAISLSANVEVPGLSFGATREIELPNGIDVPATLIAKKPSEYLRILFVGNLYEEKGIFDLLEACQRIASTTNSKIQLELIGKWPNDDVNERFRMCVQKTKHLSNLLILEPCAKYGEEKWEAYVNADLFVFPSYYRSENFPLVLLEAMAMGLPVISTRWRGIPSIVDEGVTGYLHDVADVTQLELMIKVFLSSPALLHSMGAAGKKRYDDNFTFLKYRERIVKILKEACSNDY